MKKYFKILVATDYSDAVMNAERYALKLAESTNSTLTMLHVYDVPFVFPLPETDYTELLIKNEKFELTKLKEHCDKLFASLKMNSDDLNCECIVREGKAGKEIIEEAKKMEADFIIVGTHGASGFRETFFGTHTWKIIKNASVPVLSIPQDALYKGLKHLVFATEYREGEIQVVKYLAHLAKQNDAELTILHVLENETSKEMEKERVIKFWEEIKSNIDYQKLHLRIIKNNLLLEGITDFCSQNEVDWLIMSPEKQLLFEKVFKFGTNEIKKMAFHTHIPLLTIPDFYNPEYAKFWDIIEVNEYMNEEF